MSAAILSKIAEYVSNTSRIADPPTGDLGYGSDLSCTDDLSEDWSELDGSDVRLVAEAALRRLTTARGTLLDDPDYGLDLRSFLHRGQTPADLLAMRGAVRSELLKDDRIDDGALTVELIRSGVEIQISISVTASEAPFALTLAVTDSGALVGEIL
jgi:phage baseplate assembly protein W